LGGLEIADFLHDRCAVEIVDGDLGAGGFSAVFNADAGAVAEDTFADAGEAGDEAHGVDLVNRVVGELAAAPVPEPVPVVVELFPADGELHGCGAGPEVVVDGGGWLILAGGADGGARAVHADVGEFELTELALLDVFGGGAIGAFGAMLGAALADTVVFAG